MPEDRKELYRLLKKWTRYRILGRCLPFSQWPEAQDYQEKALKVEGEIRELLYGTSDLGALGTEWDLPIDPMWAKNHPVRAEKRDCNTSKPKKEIRNDRSEKG